MPYRELFKELVAEAQAAGFQLDNERTFYLSAEACYIAGFQRDPRTFVVTKRGVWVTPMAASQVVDSILKDQKIPGLQDTYGKGPRFR